MQEFRRSLIAHNQLQVQMSSVTREPVFGVFDQVRHKPGCTATEDGEKIKKSTSGCTIYIYYSQFDKHNCIAFHRVNCNEQLLDNFKCLSSISMKFAVAIANAIGYSFSCKS